MADASRVVDIVLQVVGQGQGVIKRYVEEFSGMESAGRKAASGAQSASKSLGELEANLAKVKGFVGLKQAAQETSAALGKTQQEVAGLARQLSNRANLGEELKKGLDAARDSVSQLESAIARQKSSLEQSKGYVARLSEEYKQAGLELKQLKTSRDADAASLERAKAHYASLGASLDGARKAQKDIAATVRETQAAYTEAKRGVADWESQIAAHSKELTKNKLALEYARNEADRLKGVYAEQQEALKRTGQSLAEAGISTKNLAATQRELQAAYEKTRQVTADRDFLGLKPHREIQAEIAKVQQAYQRLAQSGQLTGKELTQAMGAARQRIRELHAQTETLDKQIKGIGASWQKMMGAAAAMGGLGAAMKQFGDFESQMLKAEALLEGKFEQGGKTIEDLNKQALALGATTRYTAGQVAEATSEAAMAGQSANDIFRSLPGVLHMAAAGGMEVGDAMDKVTNIMSQFGLKSTENFDAATKVADVMAVGFTNAATTMTQLSDAMTYCGPVADAVGYSLEDTTAILMSLANGGYKASMGGTALRGAIVKLLNPTKEGQEILDKYGIAVRDSEGKMRNFADIVRDFGESGMDMANEGVKIFGQRAGPGMAVLVNQGADAIEKFQEKLGGAGGKAKEMADKMESGFMGSMRRLGAGISAVAIAFGQTVGPVIATVADALASLLTSISKLPGPLKVVASSMTVAGAGFLLWKAGLGGIVKAAVALPKLILEMKKARASTAELNVELARVGPVATTSMTRAGAAATALSVKLKGATAAASRATAGIGGLSGALAGLFNIGMAFAGGWMFGDMLNNFEVVRKAGASLIYGFDRVMLAAKKMWKFISGGDVASVDREIEAAKAAYKGLLEDIENEQDDWSKKQRGERTTSEMVKEAKRNKGRKEDKPDADEDEGGGDEARKKAALAAAMAEESEQGGGPADNWNEEADRRRDRLAEIDEELADKRREREEKAFDEELARREKLAEIERGDRSDENYWADRLEREKELPGDEEALERQKKLHDERMAQLAEERKAAEAKGDDEALEDIGKREKREEESHEDEIARLEHEQRLKYIELEREAAQSAHEAALARIEAEAKARAAAHKQQLADIQSEREEVEEAHEEKMRLLAEELEEAQASGDKRAIREAEKNIEREEKGYEKETARLDKEEKKAIQAEAKAEQEDRRKGSEEDAAYAREQDKLQLKEDKENKEEEARKKEREKVRQAAEKEEAERRAAEAAEAAKAEKEEAERRAAEAAEAAKAEEEARTEAETEAAEEADKEREAEEEKRRWKQEREEKRRRRREELERKREERERQRREQEEQVEQNLETGAAEAEREREEGGEELDEIEKQAEREFAALEKEFAEVERAAQDALKAQVEAAEEAARAEADAAEKWADEQREAAEEAAKSVEEYYDRLKKASEEVADRQKSLSEELLELDTTKTEKQKWQILAKQAREYEKQAQAALKAGDLEKAKELADQARSAYGRLKGGAEGLDEKRVNKQVWSGVKSSGELGIAIARLQEAQAGKEARKQANIAANLANAAPAAVKQAETIVREKQTVQQTQFLEPPRPQVDRVHELRFSGGALRGGEEDIEALLRQLERAGMTA